MIGGGRGDLATVVGAHYRSSETLRRMEEGMYGRFGKLCEVKEEGGEGEAGRRAGGVE